MVRESVTATLLRHLCSSASAHERTGAARESKQHMQAVDTGKACKDREDSHHDSLQHTVLLLAEQEGSYWLCVACKKRSTTAAMAW